MYKSKLNVVLDTNVILSAIFPTSPYQPILRSIANDEYDLHVSTAILLEYEEKITAIFSAETAKLFIDFCQRTPNVHNTEVYYNWRLIHADPDDDKFVDVAVAACVDYLVTNDKHYNILKNIPFPHLKVVRIEDFIEILAGL